MSLNSVSDSRSRGEDHRRHGPLRHADLDEGRSSNRIRRVRHATSANEMLATGREIEASVLSRAIRWHAEHRIFLNGNKTVVL